MATPVRQVQTKPARQETAPHSPQPTEHASFVSPHRASSNTNPGQTSFFDGSYFAADPQGGIHRTAGNRDQSVTHNVPTWRYVYNLTLVALDTLMTLIACALVFLFSHDSYATLLGQHEGLTVFLLLACACNIVCLYACKTYERHTMGEGYGLYTKIINSQVLDFVAMCTITYIFRLNTPRTLIFAVPIISLVLITIERCLMRKALHRNRRKGEYNYPTVIVGSPQGIHETIAQLKEGYALGYQPIAVCPVAEVGTSGDDDAPQHLISVKDQFVPATEAERDLAVLTLDSHLPQTAKQLNAQTVLIADVLTRDSETMRTLSLAVESMGIELALTTKVADVAGSDLRLRNNPATPILTAKLGQYSTSTRIIKRVCDVALSTIALILASPIMIWAAIMVKHEDGGPVFYSQQRIGIYGKPFTMYKFRSMRTDADAIKAKLAKERGIEDRFIFKLKDDPRITNIGHIIRKTSIDELPQLFNVLKGDMSLVGPRPPLPEEVARYDSLYSTRLLVKPGITGAWQVSGRSDLSKEQSEFIDVSYVQDWSITGDIAILFKTVVAVLRGTGSY